MAKKKKKGAESIVDGTSPVTNSVNLTADQKQEKYKYVIRNKHARRETKTKRVLIVVLLILLIFLLLGGGIYGYMQAIDINNYTIRISDAVTGTFSLSKDKDVKNGATSVLEVVGPETMDNTSLSSLYNLSKNKSIEDVLEDILNSDGQYTSSKDCYIATTFYLSNTTSEDKIYSEYLQLIEATSGVEKALRVMLVEENDISVYGDAKQIETTNEAGEKIVTTETTEVVPGVNYPTLTIAENEEGVRRIIKDTSSVWMCHDFYGYDDETNRYLIYNKNIVLPANSIKRYSLVIWLEGNDPDCVNKIIDGKIRIQFSFTGEVSETNVEG